MSCRRGSPRNIPRPRQASGSALSTASASTSSDASTTVWACPPTPDSSIGPTRSNCWRTSTPGSTSPISRTCGTRPARSLDVLSLISRANDEVVDARRLPHAGGGDARSALRRRGAPGRRTPHRGGDRVRRLRATQEGQRLHRLWRPRHDAGPALRIPAGHPRLSRIALRAHPRRRISGCEPKQRPAPQGACRGRTQSLGGRRREAVDLPVPRGLRLQHGPLRPRGFPGWQTRTLDAELPQRRRGHRRLPDIRRRHPERPRI